MAELTETSDNTALGFFDGVEPAGSPDNYRCSRNNSHYATAHMRTRPLASTAASAFTTAKTAQLFTQLAEDIIQIGWPLLATTFVAISPGVAALIIAAPPRVAVLSVITGLIPRHVCAPYLLCGDIPSKAWYAGASMAIGVSQRAKTFRHLLSGQTT